MANKPKLKRVPRFRTIMLFEHEGELIRLQTRGKFTSQVAYAAAGHLELIAKEKYREERTVNRHA